MERVAIYGTGSSLLADIEESLFRARIEIAIGIQNLPVENFLSSDIPIVLLNDVPEELKSLPFLIPFFTPGDRQAVAKEALAVGFKTPFTLVDPTVITARNLDLGAGIYINAGCTIGAASKFAEYVLISRDTGIGHHAYLGRFVSIGPGAVLAGRVSVGKGSVIGAGAVVLPYISIGENSVVGAGSVVTKDVPHHSQVVGNPARIVKTDIKGFDGKSVV